MLLNAKELKDLYKSDCGEELFELIYLCQTEKNLNTFNHDIAVKYKEIIKKDWSLLVPTPINIFGEITYQFWCERLYYDEQTILSLYLPWFDNQISFYDDLTKDPSEELMMIFWNYYQQEKKVNVLLKNIMVLAIFFNLHDSPTKENLFVKIIDELSQLNWSNIDNKKSYSFIKAISNYVKDKSVMLNWIKNIISNNPSLDIENILSKNIVIEDLKEVIPIKKYHQIIEDNTPLVKKETVSLYFKVNYLENDGDGKKFIYQLVDFEEVFNAIYKNNQDIDDLILICDKKINKVILMLHPEANKDFYYNLLNHCLSDIAHNPKEEKTKEDLIKMIHKYQLDLSLPTNISTHSSIKL